MLGGSHQGSGSFSVPVHFELRGQVFEVGEGRQPEPRAEFVERHFAAIFEDEVPSEVVSQPPQERRFALLRVLCQVNEQGTIFVRGAAGEMSG